jgi:hypothetical protein
MILLHEVRIGNIFYLDSKTEENYVSVRLNDLLSNEFIENAVAVSLSAGRLLKFGFKKKDQLCYIKNVAPLPGSQKDSRIIKLQYNNEWAVFDDDHLLRYVKYVHELQNLYFALTNEEMLETL